MYKICISKFSWKNVDDLATLSLQDNSLLKLDIGGGWLGHQGNRPASATRHPVCVTHPQPQPSQVCEHMTSDLLQWAYFSDKQT